jgi:hypothetical protein
MCQENILTVLKFLKAVLLSEEKTISLSALGLVGAYMCYLHYKVQHIHLRWHGYKFEMTVTK